MATFLINLPPQDMQRRLSDALGVYVDAMRYPPGTENQRAAMWLEHTRRRGVDRGPVAITISGRSGGNAQIDLVSFLLVAHAVGTTVLSVLT